MFFYKLVNKLYNYNMLEKIEELLKEVNNLTASNAEEIEQLRLKYLSKKGEITALMADFRNVPADQKKVVGMKINELKQAALQKINDLKEQNAEAEESADDIDLTRSAYPISLGTRHPLTIVKNQIIDIFQRMGFTLAEGPEIDDDLHVFTKLNFAADHPARDMQDTFFIEQNAKDVTKTPFCVRTHLTTRAASWSASSLLSASSARVVYIATRPSRHALTASSTSLRVFT